MEHHTVQLFPSGVPGNCIEWRKYSKVVTVSSPSASTESLFEGKLLREIDVPDMLASKMQPGATHNANMIAGLWVGFLLGRGYITAF